MGGAALARHRCPPPPPPNYPPRDTTPGIPPTNKRARWTAAAIFQLDDEGKIVRFIKEWDKLAMWRQLGWVRGGEVELA